MNRSSFDSTIWAAKLLVFSLGIISALLLLKVVIVPYLFTFFFCILSNLPLFWIWFRSWLCPPYIYIIANFIIISIAASSTFFHHHQSNTCHLTSSTASSESNVSEELCRDITIIEDDSIFVEDESRNIVDVPKSAAADLSTPNDIFSLKESNNTKHIISKDTRKEEDEEEDTLDGMWKAIMEGKGKLVERQLMKSETWKEEAVMDMREMRKSETCRERSSREMLVGREIVPCSEELNKRVEAFIKKTNKEMRLQRLESDQRFIDMVNRGL